MGNRGKKRRRWWNRSAAAEGAAEAAGGVVEAATGRCCLFEAFSFVLLVGVAGLVPLLMR